MRITRRFQKAGNFRGSRLTMKSLCGSGMPRPPTPRPRSFLSPATHRALNWRQTLWPAGMSSALKSQRSICQAKAARCVAKMTIKRRIRAILSSMGALLAQPLIMCATHADRQALSLLPVTVLVRTPFSAQPPMASLKAQTHCFLWSPHCLPILDGCPNGSRFAPSVQRSKRAIPKAISTARARGIPIHGHLRHMNGAEPAASTVC